MQALFLEWTSVFRLIQKWLKPGVRFYVSDFVVLDDPKIHEIMWGRYGEYLTGLGRIEYRDHVFGYIEIDDTPRSLAFQFGRLRKAGFTAWEVVHTNGVFVSCFAEK